LVNTKARGFRGLLLQPNPLTVMAAPPVITVGANNAVSAITGAATTSVMLAYNNAAFTYAGGPGSPVNQGTYYGALQAAAGFNIRYQRVRFMHFGRRFEFLLRGGASARHGFSIRVNGQLVSNSYQKGINGTGSGNQLVLVDFGANTETFELVAAGVSNGGTGHAVDDVITLAGGTGTAASVRVTGVTGGVVTSFRMETLGSYSVLPSSPAAQASTTGSGTGLTVGSFVSAGQETTIAGRMIEISFSRDHLFGGLNTDANDEVYAWPEPAYLPLRTWICDSYGEEFYANCLEGSFVAQAVRLLGDCRDWIMPIAGTGYATPGNNVSSTYLTYVTTMTAPANRIVYCLGTNDVGIAAATITAAVITRLNADFAANPSAIITVVAGFSGIGATETAAIQAGVAGCSNPARVGFVDGHLWMNLNYSWKKASDQTHPVQTGHTALSPEVAMAVAASEAALLGAL
jgi:hypothetical protein